MQYFQDEGGNNETASYNTENVNLLSCHHPLL